MQPDFFHNTDDANVPCIACRARHGRARHCATAATETGLRPDIHQPTGTGKKRHEQPFGSASEASFLSCQAVTRTRALPVWAARMAAGFLRNVSRGKCEA